MKIKPDCGLLPWLAAILTIVGAGGRIVLPAQSIWVSFLFWAVISAFALLIAYFGWQCHVERMLPSLDICKLLSHIDKNKFFNGTTSQFNIEAQKILYSEGMNQYIIQPTDYCSSLVAAGYIQIVGASHVGTPELALYIVLTDKAKKVIKHLTHDGRRGR